MSKINYVLAKDEDFTPNNFGSFTYNGKEAYVEIPHIIQGVPMTSYESMFRNHSFFQGIKSTNKNIVSARQMFFDCECRNETLYLTEFDMTSVEDAGGMFQFASFKEIIWPKDKMPLHLKDINSMFLSLETSTLDLSVFDFSEVIDSEYFVHNVEADNITFPEKGLIQLLKTLAFYEPLSQIDAKFHTEELCWVAVLVDKINIKHVKIKSKKILMYLGSECPEYIEFYYNN